MNCRKATRSLGPFLDGELAPSRAEELRRHLSSCPDCALRHRRMRALLGELSSLPSLHPTPREREALLIRLRRELAEPAPAPFFHRRAQLAAAAVSMLAIAVITGVAVTVWRGEQAPTVVEREAAPSERGGSETDHADKYSTVENWRPDAATPGAMAASLKPSPSLVLSGREYGPGDLEAYRDDLGARMDFYSAYWYPASTGALDEAELRGTQQELVEEMAARAASLGGDPEGLKRAVESALAGSDGEILLPCHAELAKVNGRECWLVSLSGPEDYLLFPDPQRPPAMVLASLGGEESLAVSESLLRELAAVLAPCDGAGPLTVTSQWNGAAGSGAEEGRASIPPDDRASGKQGEEAGESLSGVDFRSFLRDLAARYNSLDMLGRLESLNYQKVIMILHGDWAGLAAEGVNLGDFLRPPRRLWAVDRESGAVLK
ncbi:MAG: zf-HC2 domain-containing protein [Actinomycetota bacterium]|nr:zf-HC2 domain-containing protein [Actinomycetota bacterium]